MMGYGYGNGMGFIGMMVCLLGRRLCSDERDIA